MTDRTQPTVFRASRTASPFTYSDRMVLAEHAPVGLAFFAITIWADVGSPATQELVGEADVRVTLRDYDQASSLPSIILLDERVVGHQLVAFPQPLAIPKTGSPERRMELRLDVSNPSADVNSWFFWASTARQLDGGNWEL